MLLLYPAIGCTEQANNSTTPKALVGAQGVMIDAPKPQNKSLPTSRKTTILQSGDILVLSESGKGKPTASYISTKPADKGVIAQRIIEILKKTQANESFLKFVETNLPNNRALKNDNFTLPLTDIDGTEYRFTYSSDLEYGLYIINYQFVEPPKA